MKIKNRYILFSVIVLLVAAIGVKLYFDKIHRQEELAERVSLIIAEADQLIKGYYYDEAIALLQYAPELITDKEDDAITLKITEAENLKDALVKYEGPIEHVFFHSLIVYPELAFDDKGHPAFGYNMWMTTVSEFKKMLPLFLAGGYVLYDLDEYVETDPENIGQLKLKDIFLPLGKKPLVISIDDVNYYEYMRTDGFADRLIAGTDNKIYTEVRDLSGNLSLTRDGDVMPILDDFVEAHPEFSFRGAKGTIALTGYQGALGYRVSTLPPGEELDNAIKEATKAADLLKANGWKFASHSYTHNGKFRDGSITMEKLVEDTEKWKKYIQPVVGETNIYISPYGTLFKDNDPRFRYIIDQGFQIYCPVGNARRIYYQGDNVVMARVNLDGYVMTHRAEEVKTHYFDPNEVLDSKRPPVEAIF